MAKRAKRRLIGRDARKGRFISVAEARRRKSTAVVERIPYFAQKERLSRISITARRLPSSPAPMVCHIRRPMASM